MYLFGILGILTAITSIITYFIMGLSPILIHLSAYAFILMGLGYLIAVSKLKREGIKGIQDHTSYIMDKKQQELFEEFKKIRRMILTLEDRKKTSLSTSLFVKEGEGKEKTDNKPESKTDI